MDCRNAHCYFPVCSGWSLYFWNGCCCFLLFSVAHRMVLVISWCALHGHCYFLVCYGWLLLFTGVLCMVTVISWCILVGRCCFLLHPGWSLSFSGALWMVTIISWSVHKQHMSHTGKHKAKQ